MTSSEAEERLGRLLISLRDPVLSPEERGTIYRDIALCYLAIGNIQEADKYADMYASSRGMIGQIVATIWWSRVSAHHSRR